MWPAARARSRMPFPRSRSMCLPHHRRWGTNRASSASHEFLAELLEALCRRGGLLLILEDFEEYGPTSRCATCPCARPSAFADSACGDDHLSAGATHLRHREAGSAVEREVGDPVSRVLADLRARARHLELRGPRAGAPAGTPRRHGARCTVCRCHRSSVRQPAVRPRAVPGAPRRARPSLGDGRGAAADASGRPDRGGPPAGRHRRSRRASGRTGATRTRRRIGRRRGASRRPRGARMRRSGAASWCRTRRPRLPPRHPARARLRRHAVTGPFRTAPRGRRRHGSR